jgi:ribokinase
VIDGQHHRPGQPERPGETVLGERLGSYPGGKGANQAVAAARLGGGVAMVGRVGKDTFGESLVENLESNGVDAADVSRDPAEPTGAALIYVDDTGQNMIAVASGANATVGAGDAQRAVARLRPGDVLVMQLEITVAVIEPAVMAARQAGAFVMLNAAPAQRLETRLLSQLDTLVVNEHEATALADPESSPERAAASLHARGTQLVIVTMGSAGSLFCDDTGVHRVEPYHVKSIDATGAGDAFMGALAVGLASSLATEAAIRFGNAAGAAATSSLGAQAALPRLDDLRRLFGVHVPSLEA